MQPSLRLAVTILCSVLPITNNNMTSVQTCVWLFLSVTVASARTFTSDLLAVDAAPVNQIANLTYGLENNNPGSLTSIFSPRMDFEQWKPLTGRGDPLRNDPTYDYEPPVLDRVHYWADETRLEREHYPERKSEVLMLGVSSRKPSVTSRQPPLPPIPPRRHVHRPLANKYEDFTYKLSEHYPMTILVPPPPPPPGHQPTLFVLSEDKTPVVNKVQTPIIPPSTPPQVIITDSTATPEHLSSFYALQESNLVYQSSSTTQNWVTNINETQRVANKAVSSDYAGWGPTTPVDDTDIANDTHNFISNDHIEFSKHPYSFYKPMLSESPPPPKKMSNPIVSTFLPTVLPPTTLPEPSSTITPMTWPTEQITEVFDIPTEPPQEITTEKYNEVLFQQTPIPTSVTKPTTSMFDMLRPMMSMPMVGLERPEDNLYAHASENIQVFNDHSTEDIQLETMQTMQPPSPSKQSESSTVAQKQQFHVNSQVINKNPAFYTHGPYLHGKFTTPIATTIDEYSENIKSTSETPTVPMYLIIQGHSKVKTYGSKPKVPDSKEAISNEISKPMETNEVQHLHPITKKSAKKVDLTEANRKGKAKNLKALIDKGLGSIEIQETDVGIKYDVSDGSEVPIEIYRKGIVDNDENDYLSGKKSGAEKRSKRQIDLEDLIPFDEDDIEEYVYNFLEGKKNETGITGLIAQAVTSDEASAVDDLENEDDILEGER